MALASATAAHKPFFLPIGRSFLKEILTSGVGGLCPSEGFVLSLPQRWTLNHFLLPAANIFVTYKNFELPFTASAVGGLST